MTRIPGIYFHEYVDQLKEHYPEKVNDCGGVVKQLIKQVDRMYQGETRFHKPTLRRAVGGKAFTTSSERGEDLTIRWAYKGIANVKPPYDIVLYSNLIQELQPKTILEFGSLQGGSGLWLADQLETICGQGDVHSFDKFTKAVSPRAKHPRLAFHSVDLKDLKTLDLDLIASFPHPWLVIDDSHVNVQALFKALNPFVQPGEYYIVEDVTGLYPITLVAEMMKLFESLGYWVDSRYTDAFGYNMTCAPNGWLKKMA